MVRTRSRRYRLATDDEIMETARKILASSFSRGQEMTSPSAVRDYLKFEIGSLKYEVFCVIYLDNRHRILEFERLFRGTIDGSSVHPREVVRECLERKAAAVIFAHNHPSGVSEPSQSDLRITERLKQALSLVDVRVLDHLIIGEGEPLSFAERGLI